MKRYFSFDVHFYALKKNIGSLIINLQEESEKEFVSEILTEIQNYEAPAYRWELSKLYDFNYDDQRKRIINGKNLKAFEYMLTTFSQIEKDKLLYDFLYMASQITKLDSFDKGKVLINSGANVLFSYKFPSSLWEPELLKAVNGRVVETSNNIYDKYLFYNVAGQKIIPIFDNWKTFSYQEYIEFIDKKNTEWIADIVNLRNSNPLLYFEKMVKRNTLSS